MKKLLAMLLAMVMVFSLAACAQGGTTNGVSATEKTAAPDNNGEKDSSTSTGDSDSIDVPFLWPSHWQLIGIVARR